jgi:MSHA type pilus biogenesis protein MshL
MKMSKKNTSFFRIARSTMLTGVLALSLTSCYGPSTLEEKGYEETIKKHYTGVESDLEKWIDRNVSSKQDILDPILGNTRNDYRKLFAGKSNTQGEIKAQSDFPGMKSILATPKKPILKNDKVVTISVTEDIPLKDVLIELARRADVDMEIDTNISGGIILSVKDRPFSDVIKRIARMAKLVYKIEDGVLRIALDVPQSVNYRFNMLNMTRTASGSLNTGNELGSGDSGVTNGSNSTLTVASSEGDMWATVEQGITNILGTGGGEDSSDTSPASSSILSLNKMAGIISIMATQAQHVQIKDYLDYVHMSHTSQVLIEAKVVEIALDDEFRSGINWDLVTQAGTAITSSSTFNILGNEDTGTASQLFQLSASPTNIFGIAGTTLNAAVKLVEGFGTTRTLSSPRLHAMNNQFAVLSFARNHVYFETTIEEEEASNDGGDTTTSFTAESEIKTVPIGVVLNLMPSIDTERNEVMMSIRPTLTRIIETTPDPSVEIQLANLRANAANPDSIPNVSSDIPVVGVRELDTVLRIKNGQVMVIGGLLSEEAVNNDRGVPGISKIPFFGNAFKSVQRVSNIIETVIFIKATIVPGAGVTVEDKQFYNKFSRDRHPLDI